MTECDITASAPVLAAIDISKDRHEVLIEAPDKKRRRRVSVLNNLDAFIASAPSPSQEVSAENSKL